jgi:RNA polymerase sigma-70 factor (ECF subfamily)
MTYSSLSPEELVQACVQSGDQAAWEEFIQRFNRLISVIVLRTARASGETSNSILEDLIQETYMKLCADRCRLLREFQFEHPNAIFGYIKVVTANVVRDHFKAIHTEKRHADVEAMPLDAAPEVLDEAVGEPSIEREILLRQIDDTLRAETGGRNTERDRLIFWLHYRQGLSARAIASLPSISLTAKGVESILLRLTRLVRAKIAGSQIKGPGIGKGLWSAESL